MIRLSVPEVPMLFLALSACGPHDVDYPGELTCGAGTHEEEGACVADDVSDADTDTDSDTDADSDSDTDSDTDADADTDSGTTPAPSWDALVCESEGDFTTLAEAIATVADGAVIALCPGTWDAALTLTRPVTITSTDGPETTALDAGRAGTVLILDAAGAVTVSGVTLQHGKADDGLPSAIWSTDTDLVLSDLYVTDCDGAGTINVTGGSLDWSDSEVAYNSGTPALAVWGADATVVRVVIREVEGESAHFAEGSEAEIWNSAFIDNSGSSYAIGVQGDTTSLLLANSIVEPAPGWSAVETGGPLTVVNSVLLGDNGSAVSDPAGTWASLSYTDIYGFACDVSRNYSGCGDADGDGLVHSDPRFVDADALDFTLDAFSPCIDAGDPGNAYNDADGSRNDMGMYGGPFGS